jgi:hypothetical protein
MNEDDAWEFRVEQFTYQTAKGDEIVTGRVQFKDGIVQVDSTAIVSPEAIVGNSMTAEAKRWLIVQLQDGPRLVRELIEEGERSGFSPAVLSNAKRQLGIRGDKEGYQGAWRWFLPDRYLPKNKEA